MKFKIKDGTILEGEPICEKEKKEKKEKEEIRATPSAQVATCEYAVMDEWDADEILVIDKPAYTVFVNKKFAQGSKFDSFCVFISCTFGAYCEFGYHCEFDSDCEFGPDCKFSSGCKRLTLNSDNLDEMGKHES